MRFSLFTLLTILFFAAPVVAQETTVIPLKIEAKKEVKTAPPVTIIIPEPKKQPNNTNFLDSMMKPRIDMTPDNRLVKPGRDVKLNPRLGFEEKKDSKSFHGDQYLGDVKTTGKFIGIVCRDHEYVDGDRVKIYADGKVIEHNLMLGGAFKGVNHTLKKGFNRIDFEALNQGTSGPNTAQVNIYDENGKVISSKKWLLSTGSKATIIVIQE
ncbi:hypothetical protein JM80_1233 [Cellulophaga sp. RHA_52]|uniref:hypothetical protein n=1 Tax=Cellulophaga sp. RHA_52 TaxID=1250036 RepID=UPI00119B66D2|nr:hypothetical protein [Cellulophaga sp. RHA_52]TVZ08733.1 hypothetical protein JM80_1233 [Cellulophaga sp. RHA_52]